MLQLVGGGIDNGRNNTKTKQRSCNSQLACRTYKCILPILTVGIPIFCEKQNSTTAITAEARNHNNNLSGLQYMTDSELLPTRMIREWLGTATAD